MSLAKLQSTIIKGLFNAEPLEQASTLVKGDERLNAVQRLGIYRHSMQGILLQHLRAVFPVVEQLVGADFFEYLTETYIDQYPPTSTALSDYGAEFASWLHSHPSLRELQWIAEVAQLEWARLQAWSGINQKASDFNEVAQLSTAEQNQVLLQLPESAQLLESNYAIHTIWLAHQADETINKPSLESIELNQPCTVLIYRINKQLYQYSLTPQQTRFIKALSNHSTLEQLTSDFGSDLTELLLICLQQGWIYSWAVKNNCPEI